MSYKTGEKMSVKTNRVLEKLNGAHHWLKYPFLKRILEIKGTKGRARIITPKILKSIKSFVFFFGTAKTIRAAVEKNTKTKPIVWVKIKSREKSEYKKKFFFEGLLNILSAYKRTKLVIKKRSE